MPPRFAFDRRAGTLYTAWIIEGVIGNVGAVEEPENEETFSAGAGRGVALGG